MRATVTYSQDDINRLIVRDILAKFHQKIEPQKVVWEEIAGTQTRILAPVVAATVDIGSAVRELNK